ncbi:MAG: hypothetical protein R3Y52_03760 [Psittacicella sp.]
MTIAFVLAIVVVILVYAILSIIMLGNVSASVLAAKADTAVAQAVYPILGKLGFVLVSIAATLAISSAILAYTFDSFHITNKISKNGMLPAIFTKTLFFKNTYGLTVAIIVSLLFVNLLGMDQIIDIIVFAFLTIYLDLAVLIAAIKLRK